jgi:hypothetical protein
MSDPHVTTVPPEPKPAVQEPEDQESEEENGETEADEQEASSLYEHICEALDTIRAEDESVDEFKVRVIQAFSNMEVWTDDRYETLDKDVQDWVYDATITHKANITKKRKKALPLLPGLDQKKTKETKRRGRASLNDAEEPKVRGRGRTSGNDCLTRTMKELVVSANPGDMKAMDLVTTLQTKYGKEYSIAAVRYAQQAFATASRLIKEHAAS